MQCGEIEIFYAVGDGICSSWPLDNARIDREWHDMVSIQGQVEMETENPERNWAV